MNGIYHKHRILTQDIETWTTTLSEWTDHNEGVLVVSDIVAAVYDEDDQPVQWECDIVYKSEEDVSEALGAYQVWIHPDDAAVSISGLEAMYEAQYQMDADDN